MALQHRDAGSHAVSDDDKRPRQDDYAERERYADQQIRRARVEMGWTQEDLAHAMRQLGFRWSQSTVARVEGGRRPVQFAEVAALADLLDIQRGSYWERGTNEPS